MCMELLNVMWMVFVQRVPELNLPYTIHLHRLIDHAVSMFMSDHKVTEGSYTVLPGGIVEEFVNGLAQQNREQYTQQKVW
ncbi:hypothetical protein SARC_14797 [Sphaeroforma arctica JP610]|uniref:Uncharacterized protein n=1 Tax=Sphaeroforma arctica JP610 TaxID=667725 RepID=A0A0L0F7K4_9EUKA|nr:hypothetical protein SARC_14797 [Sphaeroforma arctica JP610]KNC72644.1 hypothetical protein SARC_14797 [Sphaeroforma arctica JP610]|eukprot:XP_014146546.1 hypothetical protein SARC_14797 [Sphaeroforma arctica JP610]